MKEHRITVEIDADGHITADAEGFSGDACIKDLEKLLAALTTGEPEIERKPQGERAAAVRRTTTVGVGRKP